MGAFTRLFGASGGNEVRPRSPVRLAVETKRQSIGSKRGRADQRFDMTSIQQREGEWVEQTEDEMAVELDFAESERLSMRVMTTLDLTMNCDG